MAPAPCTDEIDRAEERLGFGLHPLLAAIYRDFANGGFGPDYQLLSLTGGPTSEQAVDRYLGDRANGAGTEWAQEPGNCVTGANQATGNSLGQDQSEATKGQVALLTVAFSSPYC